VQKDLKLTQEVRRMQKKILIIEDDPAAARLGEYTLVLEGYHVEVATNGVEGLKRALEGEPDLIILDVMLPGLDGFEICHRLRADFAKTTHLPILMLSAKTKNSDKETGLEVGANLYLTKPTDPAELSSCVESLLADTNAFSSHGEVEPEVIS